MLAADPRLSKLAKLMALHDDAAATDGERNNCRFLGGKIAAQLGIEFSKTAIAAAGAIAEQSDFDVDKWVREWTSMTPAQQESTLREIEEILRRSDERLAKREAEREARELEKAKEKAKIDAFEESQRKEKEERKKAEAEAEKEERERVKRVKAGAEPPQWDDLSDNHLAWLDRIGALDITDSERVLISRVRAGVRNDCLGLFGQSLDCMNGLLARAFSEVHL